MSTSLPGGFIPTTVPHGLLSPAPSNFSTSTTHNTNSLPTPRATPLKSGKRQSAFINYVDTALLDVSRKYTKKFPEEDTHKQISQIVEDPNNVVGYDDAEQVVVDFERILGLVWVSGTSSLQIPYLLNIASSLLQYLPSFPPRPTPTFRIFNKLDLAFHTLISEYKMSGTEKVRLGSIVKLTRAMVLILMEGVEIEDDTRDEINDEEASDSEDSRHGMATDGDEDEEETLVEGHGLDRKIKEEDEDSDVTMEDEDQAEEEKEKPKRPKRRKEKFIQEEMEEDSWEMEVAKVYERVLGEIGGNVGDVPIGLVFD